MHCASLHNQREDNNKFKNKNQPELTENRPVRKSDNQGDKEEIVIQTGRRGGDRRPGGEDSWQGSGQRTWVGKVGADKSGQSHIDVQINPEKQLGSETECATQGSSSGK